ncbi:Hypothetical protein FKW44_019896, partial [Caligus rogercresseyi]
KKSCWAQVAAEGYQGPLCCLRQGFRHSSSARKARTPDFIRRVSAIFEDDPSRSIRDVAKELD